MSHWRAERLSRLPPYLFVEIDRKKQEAVAAGRDVIDFGVGDPDAPTPGFIVDRMADAIRRPANHRYALGVGSPALRASVQRFFARRFGVALDASREIIALLGSKEGLGHVPTAVLDPGDVALVPDPGYPVYEAATLFAGGVCHRMALLADRGWLPALDDIPADVCGRARVMFLNYPNNPTAATAPRAFFEAAVAFARAHDILIVQDAAYSEIYFDDPPLSVLQVDGAKEVCIELHSLSKSFNMTGWRIGFAVGSADALAALASVKANYDSGVFMAVQEAGIAALDEYDHVDVRARVDMYRRRRDIVVRGLERAGWDVPVPRATFYVFARAPGGRDSMSAARRILDDADVVVIPGVGFGPSGEGYVRFALTVDEDRTRAALDRIADLTW
ncbi:MAG: LL-diaminopimelate aminotransferase [Phycisphaerae bacterium]